MNHGDLHPSQAELLETFRMRYGDLAPPGWSPRLRRRFDYFTPDEYYETVVAKLVTPGCRWLDVGCGRNVFIANPRLTETLVARCGLLVGVDPAETIKENPFLHERFQCSIEDVPLDRTFDIVTLRMVAEHIACPEQSVSTIARMTRPGAQIVIYTVNRWSPVPVITKLMPFALHHLAKRWLWETHERDTFPVAYKMNTRRRLAGLFEQAGFRERYFSALEDCRAFGRFATTLRIELLGRRTLNWIGLTYPEKCLLGVYERR